MNDEEFDDIWLINEESYLKAKRLAIKRGIPDDSDSVRATGLYFKKRRIARQKALIEQERRLIQQKIDEENEREVGMLDKREKLLKKEMKLEKKRRKNAKKNMEELEAFRLKMKADFDIDIDGMSEYADFFKS